MNGLAIAPCLRSGIKASAKACGCTGTATTIPCRSAIAAPLLARAQRRRTLDRVSMKRTEDWLYNQAARPRILSRLTRPWRAQRGADLRPILRPMPRRESEGFRRADTSARSRRLGPSRRTVTGSTLTVPIVRESEFALCGVSRRTVQAFPQDLWLRQSAAGRHRLRAPFLHNGSVPTLRDLLNLPRSAPGRFIAAALRVRSAAGRFRGRRGGGRIGREVFPL